jgi:ribulose-5-phosphate 4-epimerase/fuculose-1-phosphate aldolase
MYDTRRATAEAGEAPATIGPLEPEADFLRQQRAELAAAFRAAARYGLNEGIDNHFSLLVGERHDRFLLNPYGPHWSELSASRLLLLDLEGNVIDGEGRPERTAFVIHRAVHLARPGARCVLHTHMPYATALAMTEAGLETRASQNAMMFHGRVARLDYGGLADATEEGERIAGAFAEGTTALLLDNHGVVVVGNTVAEAWERLYFLERACQAQVLAQSTGSPLRLVSEEVAAYTARQWERVRGADALFAAVRRELDRSNPGYAS